MTSNNAPTHSTTTQKRCSAQCHKTKTDHSCRTVLRNKHLNSGYHFPCMSCTIVRPRPSFIIVIRCQFGSEERKNLMTYNLFYMSVAERYTFPFSQSYHFLSFRSVTASKRTFGICCVTCQCHTCGSRVFAILTTDRGAAAHVKIRWMSNFS